MLIFAKVNSYSQNPNNTDTKQTDTLTYKSADILVTSDKLRHPILITQPQSSINQDNLYYLSPSSVSEAFAKQPGISMISSGEGITRPVIRGLASSRIKTVVDGLGMETQVWDEQHGIGINENDFTQAIAVLGPSTLLYGPDAIAGVMIFNDEIPMNLTTTKAKANAGFMSNGLGFFGGIDVLGNSGSSSFWKLSFNTKSISDYRYDNNLRAFNTRFWRTGFNAIYGFKEDWGSIKFRYKLNFALYGILDPFELENPGFEDGEEYPHEFESPYHSIVGNRFQVNSDVSVGGRKLNLAVSAENDVRNEFEPHNGNPKLAEKFIGLTTNAVHFKTDYPVIATDDFETKLGLRSDYSKMENTAPYSFIPDNNILQTGVFFISNYKMTDWELTGGLSWDRSAVSTTNYNNLFEGNFDRDFSSVSGSAGLAYLPNALTNLSLNLSSGFRAPNVNELASKGFKPEDQRNEYGDKDLKAEKVVGIDLSFTQTNGGAKYFASVFLQNYSNFIYLEQNNDLTTLSDTLSFDFLQKDVQFYGFELGWGITKNWESSSSEFDVSFSTTKNNLKSVNYIIYSLPADKLVFNLSHNFSDWGVLKQPELSIQFIQYLNIWDDGRLVANGNGKWYHVLNANLESEISAFGNDLTVGISGKNLLNTVYIDPLSRLAINGVPNPGISINAYFKYPFDL